MIVLRMLFIVTSVTKLLEISLAQRDMIISFSYIDKYFNLIAPFYHKFYFTFFNLSPWTYFRT